MNSQVRGRLLQACYLFLVPVARFLLHCGVGYREFSELGRVAFVEVASKEFGLRGRQTNVSRVSAMTGIGRKEVSRVRKLAEKYGRDPRVRLSPLSDVLHHWYTSSKLRGQNGEPKALRLTGTDSFETLVKDRVGDVPAGAIRTELLRHQCVVLNDQGLLEVRKREVVPVNFDEKLITSLSFNLRALAETISHNSDPERAGPGRIERFVESDPLAEASKAHLRDLLREKVTAFTEGLDDLFSDFEAPPGDKGDRVGVGIYYYEDSD